MKTKKSGAYAALAAVLLISAVLITNCVDPINPGGLFVPKDKDKDQPAFVPPPGMGYVRLNFGAGRTIRPDAADFVADIDDFVKLDVLFKIAPSGSGTPVGPTSFISDDSGASTDKTAAEKLAANAFAVLPGLYNVEVWAYDDEDAVQYTGALAYGISTPVNVVANGAETASVTLKEITAAQGSGTGTFKLALTNAAAPSPASAYLFPAEKITMTITSWPGGGASSVTDEVIYDPINLYDDDDDDDTPLVPGTAIDRLGSYTITTLPPGIYRVELTLTGAKRATKIIGEVLHLYQNMTSTYTETLPLLSRNIYDVTFNYGDDRTADGEAEEVSHGGLATEPSDPKYILDDSDEDDIQYDLTKGLEGWYTTSTFASGSKFAFTTKVYRDTPLYAHWVATGVMVDLSWNPNITGYEPILEITTGANVPFTGLVNLTNPPTITISFSNTSNLYSNISWKTDATNPDDTPMALPASTTNSIDINLANYDIFWQVGKHRIIVTALYTPSGGGTPSYESAWVEFNVDP